MYNTAFVIYIHLENDYLEESNCSIVLFPDPPPKRKGGTGEYSTASDYWLAVAMDSAKS